MSSSQRTAAETYWRYNLRLLAGLLAVWFAVSFGAGILFADWLDQFRLGGFPLGFWFGQQGSILVFVALIFTYVVLIHRAEKRLHLDDDNRREG